MSISFRTKLDFVALDNQAEREAAGRPYVKPSVIRAWRLERRLTAGQAAALLGFRQTWWSWRETARMLMDPAKFEEIQRAAPQPVKHVPTLAEQVAALEARVSVLEDQLRPSRKLL